MQQNTRDSGAHVDRKPRGGEVAHDRPPTLSTPCTNGRFACSSKPRGIGRSAGAIILASHVGRGVSATVRNSIRLSRIMVQGEKRRSPVLLFESELKLQSKSIYMDKETSNAGP